MAFSRFVKNSSSSFECMQVSIIFAGINKFVIVLYSFNYCFFFEHVSIIVNSLVLHLFGVYLFIYILI